MFFYGKNEYNGEKIKYQAWEVLLKLPKHDLGLALEIARNLGFDMDIMCELLPVGIAVMKIGINNEQNS